jgi:predicted aspartyl protease
MAIVRFPYQLLNGIFQPVIPLGVLLENAWRRVDFYVDSGANYSVVSSKVAEEFEFNYLAGDRINLQVGDGGLIPVYLHDLEIQLGRERFTCPIGFSHRLGVSFNVLGKQGIFDKFKICFLESQGIISFET